MYVNTQEQDNKWRDSGGTGHVSTWMDRWMDGWMDGWVVGWMDGWMSFGIFLHVHHLAAECQNASHKHARQWSRKIELEGGSNKDSSRCRSILDPESRILNPARRLSCCLAAAGGHISLLFNMSKSCR